MTQKTRRNGAPRRLVTGLLAAATLFGGLTIASTAAAAPASPSGVLISSTGLRTGQIKHVWLIILENKSYDATFTGLNQNTYLWKTLPSYGVLLDQYYGTGHFSQDNYISLVSGQAPIADVQEDCSKVNFNIGDNSNIISDQADPNYGQVLSPAGPNAPNGTNGCTYPEQVPTLFNQLDAAGVTWKAYQQDLYNVPGREDAACGAPGGATNDPWTNPTVMANASLTPGVQSFTGAQADDQYVAKHNPLAWFASSTGSPTTKPLTTPVDGGAMCDAAHLANLDANTKNAVNTRVDPSMTSLWQDLKSVDTTPAFSWITPNNCSDAHDAVCKGNNLSGAVAAAFNADGSLKPGAADVFASDPQSYPPLNHTGGLYASDLFLQYYVTMIMNSPAFKDGGLIDITFDEGFPPFQYTGNSFYNSNLPADAVTALKSDEAGQNINGRNVKDEPTGPNTPLKADASDNQLYPGPGYNAWIDRPAPCKAGATNDPVGCVPGLVLGGGKLSPGVTTRAASGGTVSNIITDPAAVVTDTGRMVTDTVDTSGPGGTSPIPPDTFVGTVTNYYPGPMAMQDGTSPGSAITKNSFELVDQAGKPVIPTGPVTSITLSATGPAADLANGITKDPLFDAKTATKGGGMTGSVLISPYIKPGTVASTYYNHYSWLRTMEDIFQVANGTGTQKLAAGTVSGGLDGLGHLGFAAQAGLAPFGPDVFNAVPAVLTLDKSTLSMTVGDSTTLKASGGTGATTWTSSDPKIATVDGNGKVVAIAAGTATITATSGVDVATCVVTVAKKPAPPGAGVDTGGTSGTNGALPIALAGFVILAGVILLRSGVRVSRARRE